MGQLRCGERGGAASFRARCDYEPQPPPHKRCLTARSPLRTLEGRCQVCAPPALILNTCHRCTVTATLRLRFAAAAACQGSHRWCVRAACRALRVA